LQSGDSLLNPIKLLCLTQINEHSSLRKVVPGQQLPDNSLLDFDVSLRSHSSLNLAAQGRNARLDALQKKPAGLLPGLRKTQRKAAQPLVLKLCLSGLATGARREVDDLAPQIFRSPLLLGMEVYRNIEFNQFRHDVLLAGDPTPLRYLPAEPMPESGPVKVHISLFPNSCYVLLAS
jgi:hypothetical protein